MLLVTRAWEKLTLFMFHVGIGHVFIAFERKTCFLLAHGRNEVLFVLRVAMDKTFFVYEKVFRSG